MITFAGFPRLPIRILLVTYFNGRALNRQACDVHVLKWHDLAIRRINVFNKKQKSVKGLKLGDRENAIDVAITGVEVKYYTDADRDRNEDEENENNGNVDDEEENSSPEDEDEAETSEVESVTPEKRADEVDP